MSDCSKTDVIHILWRKLNTIDGKIDAYVKTQCPMNSEVTCAVCATRIGCALRMLRADITHVLEG